MATQSTIQLVVDESGAVAGFQRFDQRAKASVTSTTTATRGVQTALDQVAVAGTAAGNAQAAGHDKARTHALSNLDTVRLFRDDLGVHVPRAMEKLIARTEAFQVVATAAFSVFAFIGVIELLDTIGTKVNSLAQEWLGYGKAVREWRQQMVDANNDLIVHPQNLTQGAANYQMLQAEITRLQARKDRPEIQKVADRAVFPEQNLPDADKPFSKDDEKNLIKYQQMLGELAKDNHEQAKQFNDEDRHQTEQDTVAALDGLRKVAQERKNTYSDIDQKEKVEHSITPDQANELRKNADAKARADNLQLERQYGDQLRDMRQQAYEGSLQGEQKFYAQMLGAEQKYWEDMGRNGASSAAGIKAIEDRYYAERTERQRQYHEQTLKLEDDARLAGLTGTEHIVAQEQRDLDELSRAHQNDLKDDLAAQQNYEERRKAIIDKSNGEISRSMKQYRESGLEAHYTSLASRSGGYDQVDAEGARQKEAALKSYHEMVDGMAADDQRRVEAEQILQQRLADIQADGDYKRTELDRRAASETDTIYEQAASVRSGAVREGLAGIFQLEQDQTARINAEYEKQTRKLNDELAKREVTYEQAADRQRAIDELRDAQMAESQRATRDKLSGAIESSFRDPMGAIRSEMEHQFAQMIANWIMQLGLFKHAFGNTMQGVGFGQGAQMGGASALTSLMPHGGRSAGTGAAAFTGGGDYASYASTTAGSGSYGGYAVPDTTRGSGTSALGEIGSAANTGYSQYKSLSADYSAIKSTRAVSSTTAAAAGDGSTLVGHDAGPDAIFSQSDVNDATKGLGAKSNGTMAMEGVNAGLATYSGVTGIMGDIEQGGAKSYLNSALSGAEAGAAIGMFAGPIGALIGAGVGAGVGLIASGIGSIMGVSGHTKARKYFHDELDPKIQDEVTQFRTGSGDFQSAIATINKTAAEGMDYATRHFGSDAANYMMNTYLRTDVTKADREISSLAKAGIGSLSASAAQFHLGGDVTDFGDLWTSNNEGFIHAQLGEKMMNSFASAAHGPFLDAINSGASPAEMASRYMATMAGGNGSPGGGDVHHHWDISALDSKSFTDLLRNGGIQAIMSEQNNFAGSYAGSGRN